MLSAVTRYTIFNNNRKIRQKDISKYHIQLSLAIFFMLIVSLVLVALSAEKATALYEGCATVSVLVHYFTLVAVMWMGAESLLMFQKLVIVFMQITTKFIVSVSIICWSKFFSYTATFLTPFLYISPLQLYPLFL